MVGGVFVTSGGETFGGVPGGDVGDTIGDTNNFGNTATSFSLSSTLDWVSLMSKEDKGKFGNTGSGFGKVELVIGVCNFV